SRRHAARRPPLPTPTTRRETCLEMRARDLSYRHRLRRAARCAALLMAGWLATPDLLGADDSPRDRAGEEFFEKSIRPLLVAHCYECHSAEGIKRSGRKTPASLNPFGR